MFEPIWFGNYIVPRWEAISLTVGAFVVAIMIALLIVGGVIEAGSAIYNRMRGGKWTP